MERHGYAKVATRTCLVALLVSHLVACGERTDAPDQDFATDTGLDTVEDVLEDTALEMVEDTDTDLVQDTVLDTALDGPSASCDTLHNGLNTGFMVDGTARELILDLPAGVETDGPWAVVFNWHGMGDTAANMRLLFSPFIDNPDMPFILVTPEDTNVSLAGLMVIEWDVAVVTEANREARLFDEVLACIEERWDVDENHVHSVGFSMGSFVTDMLGTVRGDSLASIATYSGAYGCNDANTSGSMLAGMISWPEYTTTNAYAQMFLHGGSTDIYNLFIETLQFSEFAANDAAFLNEAGHDVVVCNHDGGHSVPSDMAGDKIVEFFAEHPLGTDPSPYATEGLPPNFASYCVFMGAE